MDDRSGTALHDEPLPSTVNRPLQEEAPSLPPGPMPGTPEMESAPLPTYTEPAIEPVATPSSNRRRPAADEARASHCQSNHTPPATKQPTICSANQPPLRQRAGVEPATEPATPPADAATTCSANRLRKNRRCRPKNRRRPRKLTISSASPADRIGDRYDSRRAS